MCFGVAVDPPRARACALCLHSHRCTHRTRIRADSDRYWTLQYLAQEKRRGRNRYEALAVQREEHPRWGISTQVLLVKLGLREWVKDLDCRAGEALEVTLKRVSAHKNMLVLEQA